MPHTIYLPGTDMKKTEARRYLLGLAEAVSEELAKRRDRSGLQLLTPVVEDFEGNEGFFAPVAELAGKTVSPLFVVSLENYRTDAEYQIGYGIDVPFEHADSMNWFARALEGRYGAAISRTDADLDATKTRWLPRSRFSLGRDYARPVLYAHKSGESAGYFKFVNQDVPLTAHRHEEAAQLTADFAVEAAQAWGEKAGTRKRRNQTSRKPRVDRDPESLVEVTESLVRDGGQGFQVDAGLRVMIEKEAMRQAIEHYQGEGYTVTVHGKPFDLECRIGRRTLYVEVKGTTTAGEKVFLTANEVAFAREHAGDMELFIWCELKISPLHGKVQAIGGRKQVFPQWDPDVGRLSPLLFSYQIPQ